VTAVIPATTSFSQSSDGSSRPDEAELAAAALLSRYQGRTLDAFRYDLRAFFQWAADSGLEVLRATRPEIELYVRAMEERGLAATTIDRRLSTVCVYYRFAHIAMAASPPTRRSTSAVPSSVLPTPVASTARSSAHPSSRLSGATLRTPPWR